MLSDELKMLRSRPRFRRYVRTRPEELLRVFDQKIASHQQLTGSVAAQHVFIRIPADKDHFWSPQLGLEIEEHPAGALVRGLYGPKPGIWTMFMFLYAAFGIGTLAMLFWGLSQWQIGSYPWALWFVPGGILTIGGIYLLTQFGQKLGYEQMEQIHTLFAEATAGYETLQNWDEES
ncbi:hypothetical protein GC194_01840 [bacterium]|nr:hypothetical protein [bacterium]